MSLVLGSVFLCLSSRVISLVDIFLIFLQPIYIYLLSSFNILASHQQQKQSIALDSKFSDLDKVFTQFYLIYFDKIDKRHKHARNNKNEPSLKFFINIALTDTTTYLQIN